MSFLIDRFPQFLPEVAGIVNLLAQSAACLPGRILTCLRPEVQLELRPTRCLLATRLSQNMQMKHSFLRKLNANMLMPENGYVCAQKPFLGVVRPVFCCLIGCRTTALRPCSRGDTPQQYQIAKIGLHCVRPSSTSAAKHPRNRPEMALLAAFLPFDSLRPMERFPRIWPSNGQPEPVSGLPGRQLGQINSIPAALDFIPRTPAHACQSNPSRLHCFHTRQCLCSRLWARFRRPGEFPPLSFL
jgi:hypothetical protein